MTVNYKRFVRARVSKVKFRQILRSFALDLTATQIECEFRFNYRNENLYSLLSKITKDNIIT